MKIILSFLLALSFHSMALAKRGDAIPGKFIVILKEGADAARVALDYGISPEFLFDSAVHGFSGTMSEAHYLISLKTVACC